MNQTLITVVGTTAGKPERRRLDPKDLTLTSFPLHARERRYDRVTDSWVEGDPLTIRVVCWQDLADNVFDSLSDGDPVIVQGRLCSRTTVGADGVKRPGFEVQARSVGLNLTERPAAFMDVDHEARAAASPGDGRLRPEFDRLIADLAARRVRAGEEEQTLVGSSAA